MGSNNVQWLPIATEIPPSKTRRHCNRACNLRSLPQYFLSSENTPLHIPVTPRWFKLLPLAIIVLSLVTFAFNNACIAPAVQLVLAAGATTVITASGALVVRICAVTWYCYYARLGLDLILLILWIASLAAGVAKLDATTQETFDLATKSKPTSIIALVALIIMELTLVSTHLGLSAYYIHLHRELGRHSSVVRDVEGNLLTKDNPPPGIFEVGSFNDVEDQPPRPVQNQVKRRTEDAHALASPLELDPLRMSPYRGTLTRPPKCFVVPTPMGGFI